MAQIGYFPLADDMPGLGRNCETSDSRVSRETETEFRSIFEMDFSGVQAIENSKSHAGIGTLPFLTFGGRRHLQVVISALGDGDVFGLRRASSNET